MSQTLGRSPGRRHKPSSIEVEGSPSQKFSATQKLNANSLVQKGSQVLIKHDGYDDESEHRKGILTAVDKANSKEPIENYHRLIQT